MGILYTYYIHVNVIENSNMSEWKEVPSFPHVLVNDQGHVKYLNSEKVSPGGKMANGYLLARTVGNVGEYVHRLVCEAFHGPPSEERPFVNHIDGNKTNNRADNLEWSSPGENSDHAWLEGLVNNRTPVAIVDVITGETHLFDSRKEMAEWLGAYPPYTRNVLFRSRYYLHPQELPCPDLEILRKDLIRVKHVHGEERLYATVTEVAALLGVSIGSVSKFLNNGYQYLSGHLIKRYSDNSPWFEGKRLQKAIDKSGIGIVVRNILTGDEMQAPSTLSLEGVQGLRQFRLANALRKDQQWAGGGWLVKRASDIRPWMTEEEAEDLLTRELGGIVVEVDGVFNIFGNTKEAARYYGVPFRTASDCVAKSRKDSAGRQWSRGKYKKPG